jgi:hypothetical protein
MISRLQKIGMTAFSVLVLTAAASKIGNACQTNCSRYAIGWDLYGNSSCTSQPGDECDR